MKKIAIVVLLLFGTYSYSQKNDCKIKSVYDEFKEITNYDGKTFDTKRDNFPTRIQFLKMTSKKDSLSVGYLMAVMGNKTACATRKSKVIFILTNGDKLEMPRLSTSVNCGVSHLLVDFKKEDIETLLNNYPVKGRLDYNDVLDDFEFSEKGQKEFISNLKCIIDAK